ncbi:MAG: type II secretion system major pseudopilin GspG [Pseudomonadota bacterium]
MNSINFTQKKRRGYSIVEILIFLAVIGVLAALFIPRLIHHPQRVQIAKVRDDIVSIQAAMDAYKKDNGFYPTTEQGIRALVDPPTFGPRPLNWNEDGYLPRFPHDPWGRPYEYLNPGKVNKDGIDIFTYIPKNRTDIANQTGTIVGNWQNRKQ